ncbi:oligosaccharide flippase family protein [Parvularcula lutaonensis]|uniref:Oligosaccharide flippase family protein n=1 Tax=Parvularcula lutaonensis TaxID=491923 RepID=A0ABV7MCY1_9PROT|nr:oligosaccharide flippase family protein [Parvularcula lutaonensis]GGY51237.1 lipopolysaccharide biosynthesis protein [Parvularcula lutaonensis]
MIQRVQPYIVSHARRFLGQGAVGKAMRMSATASMWVAGTMAALTFLRLLSNLVLARLLDPLAFGVVAVAGTFVVAVRMLSDIGIQTSIVRSARGEDERFLRTIWTVQIIRSLFMAMALVVIAVILAFNRERFGPDSIYALDVTAFVVAAIGVQIVIDGLASPNKFVALRKLEQKRLSVVQIGSRFVDIPVMFTLAALGFGPWSLIIGQTVNSIVHAIASHTYFRGPKMALAWDRSAFREIFHFGKWLIPASIAQVVLLRGDQFIFSAGFTSLDFSLYVTAGIWVKAIAELVNKVINQVAFSAISRTMREDRPAVARVYKRFRIIAEIVVIGAFAALLIGHEWFFTVFYPPAFEPAAEFVPFMSMALLFLPYTILNQVSLSAGDSRSFMFIKIAAALAVIFLVPYVFDQFGKMPAVLTFAVIGAFMVPPSLWLASKHMKLDVLTEIRLPLLTALAGFLVLAIYG